ncbi:MAG: DUF3606 domain-containing protein [Bacteroidota bacterium]
MKFNKAGDPLWINHTYDLGYYARRWHVSAMQIAEAIRNTGSNRISEIRHYLKKRELI